MMSLIFHMWYNIHRKEAAGNPAPTGRLPLYYVFEESLRKPLGRLFSMHSITYLFFMMYAISEPKAIIRVKAS